MKYVVGITATHLEVSSRTNDVPVVYIVEEKRITV